MSEREAIAAFPALERPFMPRSRTGKPRHLYPSHSKLFNSFLDPMRKRIAAMSDRQLNELVVACNSVSESNCSWQKFALSDILYHFAFWEAEKRGFRMQEQADAE
jgi:hypothetical protein